MLLRPSSLVCTGPQASRPFTRYGRRPAFTLIELLVVVAVIALLVGILLPALSGARKAALGGKCLAQLHVLGQGLAIYASEFRDALPPGRLPAVDSCNAYAQILGGQKFRPTFVAMMSVAVGAPPFVDPQACKNTTDLIGEKGDRQNYSYPVYYCPATPDWTDERNGSYGYNYQFLGNSRLADESVLTSYRNWPVFAPQIRFPSRTAAAGDCMGTVASYPPAEREDYINNARDAFRFGNEGFNLDPPRVDPVDGEMAGLPDTRTAVDPRHRKRANVLWLDGHVSSHTLEDLGYRVNPDGTIALDGDNTQWSGNASDLAWTPDFDYYALPSAAPQ